MATPPPNRTPSKHPRQPKGTPVSAQRYLDVAQIRDGVVVLRDGSMRAVVLVNAINFALKSEEEQNAIIFGYQTFLNSFNFPIQIVMQSRQLDLAHYIKKLGDQLAETTNELIQIQIADYIQFIERLIQIANIMDKKFYVVVPFSAPSVNQRGLVDKLFNPSNRLQVRMSPAEFKAYRQELLERSRVIMGGLSGLGLRSALLGTQEVIELLYATHNPEEATKERLSDVETITGSMVHSKPAADGSAAQREVSSKKQEGNTGNTPANPMAEVAPEGAEQPTIPNSQAQMPNEAPSSNGQVAQSAQVPSTGVISSETRNPGVPESASKRDLSPPQADRDDQANLAPAPSPQPLTPPEQSQTAGSDPNSEFQPLDSAPEAPQPLVQPTDSLELPEPLPLTPGPVSAEPVALDENTENSGNGIQNSGQIPTTSSDVAAQDSQPQTAAVSTPNSEFRPLNSASSTEETV